MLMYSFASLKSSHDLFVVGMVWVDKSNNIFQIPWKHGSRREWEHNTDAKLFRMWAQHTGEIKEPVLNFILIYVSQKNDKILILGRYLWE